MSLYQTFNTVMQNQPTEESALCTLRALSAANIAQPLSERERLQMALRALADAETTITAQQRQIEVLETLSTVDPLTGALNRRGLDEVLHKAIYQASRDQKGGVFVVLDLNGFKQINDTHGHAAGDFLIMMFSRFLRKNLRKTDTLARLGGDEFVILMPGLTAQTAKKRITQIRQALAAKAFDWKGTPLTCAFASGLCEYNNKSEFLALYKAADKNLYADKSK